MPGGSLDSTHRTPSTRLMTLTITVTRPRRPRALQVPTPTTPRARLACPIRSTVKPKEEHPQWRRLHLGKGHLLLVNTAGSERQVVAFTMRALPVCLLLTLRRFVVAATRALREASVRTVLA